MYSANIQGMLKRSGLGVGDRASVITTSGKAFEGIIMPQTEFGDPDALVLKLDNGYNVGIRSTGITLKKLPGGTRGMGKTGRDLLKLDFDKGKPPISLISTGGTIASRVDYRTGGVYAIESPEEFLHNVPELKDIAYIREFRKPFTKMSEDMDPQDWQSIAKEVAEALNSGSHGAIVTHGTDFLHYTSAALSFFLRGLSKPVVLMGAQRSADRGSSDAGMNLICSARTAVSDIGEVGVCMHGSVNDDYCLFTRGTHVRKMHTSRRDAFRAVNERPIAKVWPSGKIEAMNSYRKSGDSNVEVDSAFEPKVALLKTYPGSDPEIIESYIARGYKGFVIEGSGLGHVPTFARKSWIEHIKRHSRDVPFVVTSQTIYGRVSPDVYTNLRILFRDAEAIPGGDILTETAYVKLGWVLAHAKDPSEARRMMLTNYAGEITERSEYQELD